MAVTTYIDAINAALHEEMQRDPTVFVIGEEGVTAVMPVVKSGKYGGTLLVRSVRKSCDQ